MNPSELFDFCANIVRADAKRYRQMPAVPHPADRRWSELTRLDRENEQLKNQLAANERRMRQIADELQAMAAARKLPGLA